MTEITAPRRVLSVTELDGFHMILTGGIGRKPAGRPCAASPPKTPAPRPMTMFQFDFSLPPPPDGDTGCERIKWRLVNRWTWGDSLGLGRKPHCLR